jgi:lipoprotein-anchoring transpeptidase ErfK/SrfK
LKRLQLLAATAVLVTVSACEVSVTNGQDNQAQPAQEANQTARVDPQARQRAQQIAQARASAQRGLENVRFEVDISDRKVRVFNGRQKMAEHDVAVGSEEWPTPTGSYAFHRVDLNPEWIPPKSEAWAEDEERKAPGDPENPMGRARLVYRMPNTIHGTDDLNSLGKAVSHGSIRVANEVALDFAELLLKAGGAWESDQWFQQMVQNRTREFQIPLEKDIPIEVKE